MSTVAIDIKLLDAALSSLSSLAQNIDSARNRARSSAPVDLPSLADGRLGMVSTWLEDQKPVLKVRRDIAILLAGKHDGIVTYEVAADTLAANQQLLAYTLAEKANDVDSETDPEQLELLNEMLGDWQHDAQVMQLMFDKLEPRGTARLLNTIQENMYLGGDNDELLRLATTLRTGLASATQSPYFDGDTYGRELVRNLVAPLLSREEQEWQMEHMGGMYGASTLAFLFRGRGYGDDFLVSAGNQLLDFEKRDPEMALYWYAHNGYGPLDQGYDGRYADPMAELLKSMSTNPEASSRFLSDADTRDFLFDKRDFSADGYDGVSALADTASTNPELVRKDPRLAALIASEFVDKIADSEGFNPEDAKAASDSVAHILKSYMPSMATALDGPGGDGDPGLQDPPLDIPGFGKMDHMPLFYRKDLASLTAVAMSTEDGMTDMAEGVAYYQQTQVNAIADQLADDPDNVGLRTQLNSVLKDQAELRGFTTRIAGQTQIDDAVSTDKQRQGWINLVSDATDLVPIKNPVTGWVVGQGVDLGTDALTEAWAHTSKAATNDANAQATAGIAQMNYETYTSLVDAGVIPDKDVPDSFYDQHHQLKPWSQIADTDHAQSYSEAAAQGMSQFISDEDLETTYRSRFQDFYTDPAGD